MYYKDIKHRKTLLNYFKYLLKIYKKIITLNGTYYTLQSKQPGKSKKMIIIC